MASRSGTDAFFDGVSGILVLLPKNECGRSTFLFRFEIRPVDMNAAGRGRAVLNVSGVSKLSPDSSS